MLMPILWGWILGCWLLGASREAQTLALLAKFETKLRTVQRLEDSYKDNDDDVTGEEKHNQDREEQNQTDDGWWAF